MTLFAQEGKRYVEGYLESNKDYLIFIQCEEEEETSFDDPIMNEKERFRAKHSKLKNVEVSTKPEFEIDGFIIYTTFIFFEYEDECYLLQMNDEEETIIKGFEQLFSKKEINVHNY